MQRNISYCVTHIFSKNQRILSTHFCILLCILCNGCKYWMIIYRHFWHCPIWQVSRKKEEATIIYSKLCLPKGLFYIAVLAVYYIPLSCLLNLRCKQVCHVSLSSSRTDSSIKPMILHIISLRFSELRFLRKGRFRECQIAVKS